MSMTATLVDGPALARSRDYCESLTRRAARNFYYGLKLLPEGKRAAMFALYAYMRMVDDIADEEDGRTPDQRAQELEAWRLHTHAVLGGQAGHADAHELWPAFAEMVHKFKVPVLVFDEVIAGQRQDLEYKPFETFEELRHYCYRVAGVVGLASIHIWGFEGGASTESLAIDRGIAFQLTNILRDLKEDAMRNRIYLPLKELSDAQVTPEDLTASRGGKRFGDMMLSQIDRAQRYYEQSSALDDRIDRDSRASLVAMTRIYHGILKKVAQRPERVLHERVSLSLISKLCIGWRAMWGT